MLSIESYSQKHSIHILKMRMKKLSLFAIQKNKRKDRKEKEESKVQEA